MQRRQFLAGVAAISVAGGCAAADPGPRAEPRPVSPEEHAAVIAALKPPKRSRPLVAVAGDNAGSETTDYVIPYSVLRESGLFDVHALARRADTLKLMPALKLRPSGTLAQFDRDHPSGADYVIVPAMHDPHWEVVDWIRSQHERGAIVVGVCEGALILGRAGLLDGRKATTHWYAVERMFRANPGAQWIRDRRYVADGRVVTTTGVTASLPVSLAIAEAAGGSAHAAALASDLGVDHWDARHDSGAFRMTGGEWRDAALRTVLLRGRDAVPLAVADGVDELALALTADAWSRTYRSQAEARSAGNAAVRTLRGLELEPDGPLEGAADWGTQGGGPPAHALETALEAISARYGEAASRFVALQLEYPL